MLFIVIHQVYELWFKQVLHELGRLEQGFAAGQTAAVLGTFKRILTILKTLVAQVDVLETMTPVEFGSFRARLESASGFQSQQFRLIEVRLGKRDPRLLAYLTQPGGDARAKQRLEQALAEPPLYAALPAVPGRQGIQLGDDPAAGADRHLPEPPGAGRRVRTDGRPGRGPAGMALPPREDGRAHHRPQAAAPAGRPGPEYLRTTLAEPLFPDLWAIRSEL